MTVSTEFIILYFCAHTEIRVLIYLSMSSFLLDVSQRRKEGLLYPFFLTW